MSCLSRAISHIDALLQAVDQDIQRTATAAAVEPAAAAPPRPGPDAKKKKQKKGEGKAGTQAGSSGASDERAKPRAGVTAKAEDADPFVKANLRVARVIEVGVVENSDKLYKLRVDAGAEPLQVIAGLRKYVAPDALLNRLVVTVLNLKPAKLAGELSEGMILAADCTLDSGDVLVAPLTPPTDARPGDPVFLTGGKPPADTPKVCKREHWTAVVERLRVLNHRPVLGDVPLCTTAGPITVVDSMPDNASIH